MSHFVVKCRICDRVISQCRCIGPNKTVSYDICDDCTYPIEPVKVESEPCSDHILRMIEIEEYFTKEEGVVYWHYCFRHDGKWHKDKTSLPEIPVIKVRYGKTL